MNKKLRFGTQIRYNKKKPTSFCMFHKDGYKFMFIAWVATFILGYFSMFLGVIGIILAVFVTYFFRNPKRYPPQDTRTIIAPADGIVVAIDTIPPPKFLECSEPLCTKISIFLNIFDVHVNCIPVDGRVLNIIYHKGQFLNASFDKSSELNEKNVVIMEYNDGRKLAVCQIAGLIARRIRCDLTPGQTVYQAERFGIIRFGSRVDIYFDQVVLPLVGIGQRVRMGETVLFKLP